MEEEITGRNYEKSLLKKNLQSSFGAEITGRTEKQSLQRAIEAEITGRNYKEQLKAEITGRNGGFTPSLRRAVIKKVKGNGLKR